MKLYRFSPIKTKQEFEAAYTYIAEQLVELTKVTTGQALPFESLKVFAHYPDEYNDLRKILLDYGPAVIDNATSLYVKTDMTVGGSAIQLLGIRTVDPYRFQVGCGDVAVGDYQAFRTKHLDTKNGYVRDMPGREDAMIEIWHPDFDVTAYILREKLGG